LAKLGIIAHVAQSRHSIQTPTAWGTQGFLTAKTKNKKNSAHVTSSPNHFEHSQRTELANRE
jgi:hypothetical protein